MDVHAKIDKGLKDGTLSGNDTVTVSMLQALTAPDASAPDAAPGSAPTPQGTAPQGAPTPA